MPELPDILLYLDALRPRTVGQVLTRAGVVSPFVLGTVDPPIEACEGRRVTAVDRLGKRFCLDLESGPSMVVHLMVAGRWRWNDDLKSRPPGKIALASFAFGSRGMLHLVEPSPKKRASIHVHATRDDALAAHGRGGIDVFACAPDEFARRLRSGNHTIKRSLTDPELFDGIGNAYSDEILHAAGVSPVRLTSKLSDEQIERLHSTARKVLGDWTDRLRREFAGRFPGPGDVTAFRPDFAVHGKFNHPCPVCRTPVQRIRYADNETNYCPRCQTEGVLLADRSLSRLLKKDWPRSIDPTE